MRFLNLIFHLLKTIYRDTSTVQFFIFLFLFLILTILGIITFIKVVIPFTYIAL